MVDLTDEINRLEGIKMIMEALSCSDYYKGKPEEQMLFECFKAIDDIISKLKIKQ